MIKVKEEIKLVIKALSEKKAENIRLFDLEGNSSFTDYVIIATATSGPHAKALKSHVDFATKENGIYPVGEESSLDNSWMVIDGFYYMVHIQTEEMRDYYDIDGLCNNGKEINIC